MRRVNLFEPEHDGTSEREGYRWRSARIGHQLGATRIGASVYDLDEGERTFPYHFHHTMEEWLLVVDGSPTLRGPEGERTLRAGDLVCFRVGREGGHQLRGPGRVLLFSTGHNLEAIEYPESGKLGVRPPGKVFRTADAVGYWEGEA